MSATASKISNINSLDERRKLVADTVYEDFDFGGRIEGANGWERTSGSDEATPDDTAFARNVFLAGDDDGAPSDRVTFVVRFQPGSDTLYDAGVSGW